MDQTIVSAQDGPRLMGGISNFGGKKAAPFGKGGKRVARKRAAAKATLQAKNLSNYTGQQIDLDWTAWNANHKKTPKQATGLRQTGQRLGKGPKTPVAPKPKPLAKSGTPKGEIQRFKKMTGTTGKGKAAMMSALEKRASEPGHLRAKAILAAETGHLNKANKIEKARAIVSAAKKNAGIAKGTPRAQAMATLKARSSATAKAAVAAEHGKYKKAMALAPKPKAPKPYVPPKPKAPAAPKPPVYKAPKPPVYKAPKPPVYKAPKKVKSKFAAQAKANAAHANAVHKNMALSNVDLAKLSTAERNALPASAFVFPKSRRYPIHDKSHAENALARSAGKPEHAVVKAAVKRRYPDLGK